MYEQQMQNPQQQAPQVQAPHPTVPYGQQPGQMPQGLPQPPLQQPQQAQPPHPTVPYGQQGVAPQPQQMYQAGQQMAQQQRQEPRRLEVDDSMIMDGPAVPPELRGRTFGQVKQIYTALSSEWLNRQGASQQPQQPQQRQPQQQAPQAVQRQGQQQEPGDDDDSQFWQSPGRYIRESVRSMVSEALQPVTQQTNAAAIAQARTVAAQGIPDFGQLEGEIMQILGSMETSALTNPEVWIGAADLARGRVARARTQPNGPQMMQPQQAPRSVPANLGSQSVPQYQFFAEAPTPPQLPQQGSQPTPQDEEYARRFGMDIQTYMSYKQLATGG